MPFQPGNKLGKGRKPGSKNMRTRKLDELAAKGITPLDYMLKVLRDKKVDADRRDRMAEAAAPYLHPKRAPEDKHGRSAVGLTVIQTPLNDDD